MGAAVGVGATRVMLEAIWVAPATGAEAATEVHEGEVKRPCRMCRTTPGTQPGKHPRLQRKPQRIQTGRTSQDLSSRGYTESSKPSEDSGRQCTHALVRFGSERTGSSCQRQSGTVYSIAIISDGGPRRIISTHQWGQRQQRILRRGWWRHVAQAACQRTRRLYG